MESKMITQDEYINLGKKARGAAPHNLLIASFAAELIGEGYPLSKAMRDIIFKSYTDEELGRKFVEWTQEQSDIRARRAK